jgi:membrane associated rhomboid family serine protease
VVLPVHDLNPVRRTPWVTYLLIAANVVVFLLTPAASGTGVESVSLRELCQQEAFYDEYAAIPKELVQNRPLAVAPTGEVGVGPSGPGCVAGPPSYRKIPVLSVLYAMFLHGGWLHLLGNMLFLWVFGNNVEDRFGRLKFLLFYLLCGYLASYGFALANAGSLQPLIGASGAVSGVLGAYLVLFPRARVWSLVPVLFFIPLRLPAWLVLGLWFVLQWVYSAGFATSAAGAVAYLAHVVGFVAGMLLALPFRRRRPPELRYYPPSRRRGWRANRAGGGVGGPPAPPGPGPSHTTILSGRSGRRPASPSSTGWCSG